MVEVGMHSIKMGRYTGKLRVFSWMFPFSRLYQARLSIFRECCSGSMKCIPWSEKIYKNTWDEQYYIVILQLYFLINLLNHRVNIMLRERVFNFTASLVGNVTVKRTVTQTFSTFVCFCHVDQGKDLLSQRYRKTKRIQLINPEKLHLMILAHLLVVFLLCSWVLTYGYFTVFILWVIGQKSSTNSFWRCPNCPLLFWTP